MHHLGMEHQPVISALLVLDHRERRIRGCTGDGKARRHLGDAVAMAHPDRMFFADAPGGIEQPALGPNLEIGAAEFAVVATLDLAAELRGHGHLAVADAEHGNAGIEDQLRRARRAFLMHRIRAAGEDHRLRLHRPEGGLRLLERHDLGIDPLLAHPPRDQLGDLAAEIDDQNLVMRRGHLGTRLAAGCAAVMASNYATGGGLATPENRPSAVIASLAKQSTPFCAEGWIASSQRLLAMAMRRHLPSPGGVETSEARSWGRRE